MIVLKDCPNCGSFDIEKVDSDHDLMWLRCRSCNDEWIEEVAGVGFDLADDGYEYEYRDNDGSPTVTRIEPMPDDLPDDIRAWLATNY